ncbi:Na+/H+ antiporter NhaC [Pontibacillus marinus]|uniref:Sodium:proton antiporter n=1 Tax=Pontibacillus marinus BH030004 = DSM 16465 TaxID=1385511 RepID=A0A0A5I3D3_9BACI|nr:Na+/H+ antiporter NhaC [Pontibacillus marinus]KGX90347.1 sodium:proton antiporter [Pontibacillus marinus BH030004 = DSM 16465]
MKKEPSFLLALIPILALIISATSSIVVWEAGMFMPLIIGIIATAAIGFTLDHSWDDLQGFMKEGVTRALPAVFILLIIGTIVGAWILSGTIPTIIYYGLTFINPNVFLPTVALITGIVAVTLGSSFTAIATVGLAFMAIGTSMGFPAAHIVGATVSGAFFGDKLSPLSDTTNVAPAMVGVNLFDHVRHMLWDTIPAFILTILLFWFLGMKTPQSSVNADQIQEVLTGLSESFVIHPLLLLLPLITIILMAKRYPAVPSLVIVSALGGFIAVFVQGSGVSEVINAMTDGYKSQAENETIKELLSRGGLTSMLNTIGLIVVATALGGMLEGVQVFKVLLEQAIEKIQSTGSLILSTLLSTLVVSFASGSQFLALILPTRAFLDGYEKRGIDPKNLSRSVEAAGTVGINLVPWGVPAVFVSNLMNVSPYSFIPFIFFSYLVILINMIYGFTGWTIEKKQGVSQSYDLRKTG